MCKACKHACVGLAVVLAATAVAAAQDIADLTTLSRYETPMPYTGVRNWHVTQNMGPTGVRYWVEGNRGHSRDSRQLLVKSVEAGSPADGVLRPYDVIVGAAVPPNTPSTEWATAPAVQPFDSDARLSIARAITWAESDAGGGELKLLRFRDGRTETVTVKLPVMGTYSATAPYDCAKTERIVADAAAFLAENMPANGYFDLPGALNAIAMLASGDDRYLDHVRRSAMRMGVNHTINDAGHETWRWGNTNTFLCEYYLATGDRRVLPQIKGYADALAAGQCNPGTWGHRAVPDFIPPGYGSLNSSGVVCFISLALARQAGVDYDTKALERSIRFYGSYAGRGSIPYGDHPPGSGPTANGKNGMGAVGFYQLGADPAAQWFARLCASTNLAGFEGGHTGNFFNQTWAPLGASLAGRGNYQRFWQRFNSYRDMCRRADGGFVTQPWPQTREGDLGTGNYVRKGPMWTTGGYTLSYLAGTNRLAVLGRRDSVFGANPPEQLKPALDLYHAKRFAECREALTTLVNIDDERVSRLATQLDRAAERNINSLELTLADMGKTLEAGDLYTLKWQLQAIESIVDTNDQRLARFRAAVDDPANEPVIATGEQFHRNVTGPQWSGPLGFQVFARRVQADARARGAMEQIAKGDTAYASLAGAYLARYPKLRIAPDKPLFDTGEADAWRMTTTAPAGDGWKALGFDDSKWQAIALPYADMAKANVAYLRRPFDGIDAAAVEALALQYSLKGEVEVYLNGTLVIRVKGTGWPPSGTLPLTPAACDLLKPEGNCLAIKLTTANGDQTSTLGLAAWMKQGD